MLSRNAPLVGKRVSRSDNYGIRSYGTVMLASKTLLRVKFDDGTEEEAEKVRREGWGDRRTGGAQRRPYSA